MVRLILAGLLAIVTIDDAYASLTSVGSDGINSANLPYDGTGIMIGQLDYERPGDPDLNGNGILHEPGIDDDSAHSNETVDPEAVFIEYNVRAPIADNDDEIIDPDPLIAAHATRVAGVIISSEPVTKGVAPGAELYATAGDITNLGLPILEKLALSAQYIELLNNEDTRAMNISILAGLEPSRSLDGNNLFTQFIDWASGRYETLYVTAGDENLVANVPWQPLDNFNGIKVGASAMESDGVYRRVASINRRAQHPNSNRTLIDIIAPGQSLEAADIGTPMTPPLVQGTSFAAPHVTGTVALLQEYGEDQFTNPGWDEDFRRHEVMKAVLMNSADKIKDDGTADPPGDLDVPPGGLLGMERTVVKKDGTSTWFDSDAYPDVPLGTGQFTPLDEEMGTGHLNASRAFTQFSAGEHNYEDGDIPLIGWDYGTTTGMNPITQQRDDNRYRFEEPLLAGSFVSITIAWDRDVDLDIDAGTINEFDAGDTFEDYEQLSFEPEADSVINDLDLHFMPKFSGSTGDAEASSVAKFGTVDHIFFQVPTTGPWEFWVEQWDQEDDEVGASQDYAVAWWAFSGAPPALGGDFNGDGMVDAADLAQWKGDFGPSDDGSDADGDGDSDGRDFLAWQRSLGMTSATSASATIPEPSAWLLTAVGLPLLRRKQAG